MKIAHGKWRSCYFQSISFGEHLFWRNTGVKEGVKGPENSHHAEKLGVNLA